MAAISIHIGLNKVNPATYGTEARLAGCHNDARAMADLAKGTGFTQNTVLLDGQATSKALIKALKGAAATLTSGDSLLLTYSGHGSQVQDSNNDEPDHADETLCLYDRMFLDDELAALWTKFKKGVRITMLSDSCHSGTVTKEIAFPGSTAAAAQKRSRLLPREAQEFSAKKWEDEYKSIQLKLAPAPSVIKATVILISGCQDHETSLDGDDNGLFTGTLLEVWDNGNFTGNLKKLELAVRNRIHQSQNPNYHVIGAINTPFAASKALRP